mgnify:FL=1
MKVFWSCFTAVFCLALVSPGLSAATYTVTQGACEGAGSLRDAVNQANANPGKDFIGFDSSITTVTPTGFCFESIRITDSVEISGAGNPSGRVVLSDNVTWISLSGNENTGLACDTRALLLADGDVPFVIEGDSTTEVTISNVLFEKNFGILEARNLATVNLQRVAIRNNYQGEKRGCNQPLVSVVGQLNMTDVDLLDNTIDNKDPRDALVWVLGGARLERVEFSSNRSAATFYHEGDGDDISIIRESTFSGAQPRVILAGVRGSIINSLIVGESPRAMGVHAWNSLVEIVNTTISSARSVAEIRAPSGAWAAATHVLAEETGQVLLANTIVDGEVDPSRAWLPMVAATGAAKIEASKDSHISDGSGPQGFQPPTTGSSNLNGIYEPLGPPSKHGGRNDLAFDQETLGPLQIYKVNKPRIQGPAVDKGAFEIQENHAYDDDYEVLVDTPFDSTTSLTLSLIHI